jgi:penicillin-binding protein 1A
MSDSLGVRRLKLVQVPPRNWRHVPLQVLAFLALVALTGALAGVLWANVKYGAGLPAVPNPEVYRPPIVTEVHTSDSVLAGEFYNERRKVVPYEYIPKRLVQAFIAAEDADFFDHQGIDWVGTARAVTKTVIKKVTGKGKVQGGSTLTQQTAKAVLISTEGYKSSTEKSVKRKIREALLARRLEKALTKEQILYLYLNNVYLGHHSYGVQSAAENYFRKDVRNLTLAEMALLAGLPQAPSTYSPFTNREGARKRRTYVLTQMLEKGMISKAEHDTAMAAEISVYPVEDVFHEFAPYFTEEVRRDIVSRYGNSTLLGSGLRVFTTMDSEKQRAAQEAVLFGLLRLDKRQGFRGALQQLASGAEQEAFIAKSQKAMGAEKVTPGHYYVALVTKIAKDGLTAEVNIGGQKATLPAASMRWARPVNAEKYYPNVLVNKVSSALKVGDVVVVKSVSSSKELYDDDEQKSAELLKAVPDNVSLVRLEQEPEPQSALVSIDPQRQYLVAMVGGYDFDANEFNRAFQACRQPGSSFKPIVYSGALELMGWTQGTVILDSPLVYDDPENQNRWKPDNFSSDFQGEVLLKHALVNSMNIPAVKTYIALAKHLGNRNEVLGIQKIGEYAKRLGFSTPINPDYSTALGSACVYPYELAQVYATLNRLGLKKPTYFIRKVEDRFGRTIEDHTAWDDPWASLNDRVAGGYAKMFEPGEQVISRETGYLMTDIMRGVVTSGTGAPASRLKKPAAGKTGTTNDSFDAWFTAFTKDLVTSAWVGYDLNPHPLGKFETGGRAALPIWLTYMQAALDGRDQPEFSPPGDLDLVRLNIDKKSGKISRDSKTSMALLFKRGTEPDDVQLDKGQVDTSSFIMQSDR